MLDEAFEQIEQVGVEIEQGLNAKARKTLDQIIETLGSIAPRGRTDDSGQLESTLKEPTTNLDQNACSLALELQQST